MNDAKVKVLARKNRHARIRKKVSGTTDCPRVAVFRSLKNIYVQIIDDVAGNTLVSASSLSPAFRQESPKGIKPADAARLVGKMVADAAREKGINRVVFDRGGYVYHGRVKALAEAARENGLKF
jgi:large subunit ribosomal protein L18